MKFQRFYQKLDGFVVRRIPLLAATTTRSVAMTEVQSMLQNALGYDFYSFDIERPWGGYFRIGNDQLPKFLKDFFPGYDLEQNRSAMDRTELSPKIMVLMPGQRISWQYHDRRAERWHFLTPGIYWRSQDNSIPKPIQASAGEVVQFNQGERHRGGAPKNAFVLIAEIWQHTDPKEPSDEADVYRLKDDYKRPKHPKRA